MNVRFFKWIPIVEKERCSGCARCVEACGPKSIEMFNWVAICALPDACGSDENCIKACAADAMRMEWVELEDCDKAKGKWRADVEFSETTKPRKNAMAAASSSTRARVGKLHPAPPVLPG